MDAPVSHTRLDDSAIIIQEEKAADAPAAPAAVSQEDLQACMIP